VLAETPDVPLDHETHKRLYESKFLSNDFGLADEATFPEIESVILPERNSRLGT
jgi:hypothetical protein